MEATTSSHTIERDFDATLRSHGLGPLTRRPLDTLQINLGKVCNQACTHCHVEAGPKRTESMTRATAERVVQLLEATPTIEVVDITGGAPELNPSFRWLVERARALGTRVLDRCNLTILSEPGHEDLAEFLADHEVTVIASLPCYTAENVDKQRGKGTFGRSIAGLRRLNALGYGRDLALNLVYNPLGAFLPPAQEPLERRYKAELREHFGIEFNHLYTLTNMPISRFLHWLRRTGELERYQELLVASFNPGTVAGLMCRDQISVGWDGRVFDCDFNQMLELDVLDAQRARRTIWTIDHFGELANDRIRTRSHCFGCSAGAGSSCGGALE